jgi:hypothetical protein
MRARASVAVVIAADAFDFANVYVIDLKRGREGDRVRTSRLR